MRTGKAPSCVRQFWRPRNGREQFEQRTHDVALVIGDLRGGGTQCALTRLPELARSQNRANTSLD